MKQKNNIIIEILSVLGGLLTAGFFMGFLLLLHMPQTMESIFMVSSLLIGSGIILSRIHAKLFLDGINLALFIAGSMLPLIWGGNSDLFYLFLIVVSILTYLLSGGFLLPFAAVILFNLSFFGEIAKLTSSYDLVRIAIMPILTSFMLLHLYRDKIALLSTKYFKYKPLHTGLFACCLITVGAISIPYGDNRIISPFIWFLVFFLLHRVMPVWGIQKRVAQAAVYVLALGFCIATLHAPYLSGTLFLIFLCFHYGYRKECGIALLLFAYAVSKYYYDMNLSLLAKSGILFFTGIVFLGIWYYLTQKRISHEEI